MLFCFDLDDTLIEGYLETVPCPTCQGSGRFKIVNPQVRSGSIDVGPCTTCRGHCTKLVHKPEGYDRVEWLPGRLWLLRGLAVEGHNIAVVSNQTGPSYGYGTIEEVRAKMRRVHDEFLEYSGYDLAMLYCTDKDDVENRKPAPGMIIRARDLFNALRFETVMVGDLPTDEQAARAAHVAFAWADDFFTEPTP